MHQRVTFRNVAVILVISVVLTSVPQATLADEELDRPVRFAILGDRAGEPQPGIYGQIVNETERLRPDFVMTVGDMIEGYPEDSNQIIAKWYEYDSIVAPLSPTIYFTPGNNDIWSDLSEKMYRRHVDAPYHSFDHGGIHFVILDVSRWESSEEIPGEQINWLIDDLNKNANAPQIFVFYHKPFWEQTTAEGKPDTLHSLFVEFGVDAVFTGHYHDYFSGEYDGIMYTSIGSSGGGMTPAPSGLGYHFVWVTADDQGIHVAPIKIGSILPWDEITVDEREAYQNIRRTGLRFEEPVPVADDLSVAGEEVAVVVSNADTDIELNDTLYWQVPEGWSVEPESMPVRIAPRGEAMLSFIAQCTGNLYPVPSASVEFTYAEGKQVTSDSYLRIARNVNCSQTTSTPNIDGDISEDCWRDPVTQLFDVDGTETKTDPVRFYFAHDTDNLYIAAYCEDAMADSLLANVTEHDGAIYGEDCIGYFLEPDFGSETVYQIYINPLGTVFDQKLTMGDDGWMVADRSWNGDYEVKTVVGDHFWSMEARIPSDQLGGRIEKGKEWRLNFRRKQRRLSCAANWQTPIDYDPGTYGRMTME
jgi:hypothetical protein